MVDAIIQEETQRDLSLSRKWDACPVVQETPAPPVAVELDEDCCSVEEILSVTSDASLPNKFLCRVDVVDHFPTDAALVER